MKYFKVYFEPIGKLIHVHEDTLLSEACSDAGYPLDLVCGGKGTCGKCKVLIQRHNIKEEVHACMTKVTEDMTVYLKEENLKREASILTDGEGQLSFNPSIRKEYISKESLALDDYGSFWDAIYKNYNVEIGYPELKKIEEIINNDDLQGFTIVMEDEKIIQIQNDDTSDYLYGVAIDIGTTTVVLYLYDLKNGRLMDTYSDLNSQLSKGADVISRIMYCTDHEDGTEKLQSEIIKTINSMIENASKQYPQLIENLHIVTTCGNSTMQHLFFGFNPKNLGQAPFLSIKKREIIANVSALGLMASKNCKVYFLPLIGGFVGADTSSVLLSIKKDNKLRLIVDLGTNGEIAVGNSKKYMVASTACGPALEGAGIQCGMRGAKGAIEKFEIKGDQLTYKVIGDQKAKGICGSGIVDITAELVKHKVINKAGKMLSKEEFEKKCPESSLSRFIKKIDKVTLFMIVPPEDCDLEDGIYISQKDVRQIQLAKSAIYTGCMMLIEKFGIKEPLEELLLAGSFGNYMNTQNAEKIGIIPHFDNVRAKSIGNAAGVGVQMYLLDKDERACCENIANKTMHYELATDPVFQDKYLMNMGF